MKLSNAKKYIMNNRIDMIIWMLLYNLTYSTYVLLLFEEQHHE